MRSIRSSSRATTTERGFALIWAIGLAVLFFMLIELMLIDASRELAEARRFRARIVAETLAENGAELAAVQIASRPPMPVSAEDWQGKIKGQITKAGDGSFVIVGEGTASGTERASATVRVEGRVEGTNIIISFTRHKE